MPLIIRVDGKGFHGVTRGCERPFDGGLIEQMNEVAKALCEEAQGAVLGFVQSDEVSVLVHNYKRLQSEAWFDNEVQKIASVSAAIAAARFTSSWPSRVAFDARVFVLPEAEVCNYFIWRQQDATRNSIQMATRAVYSHAQVDDKNTAEMQEMLHAKGINWNDYPVRAKRGGVCLRETYERDGVTRHRWRMSDPPIFTQDRAFIDNLLATGPEDWPAPASPHDRGPR